MAVPGLLRGLQYAHDMFGRLEVISAVHFDLISSKFIYL